MAVQVSYPGVYIEEFAPAPPIQGVGTSTAAFIGPARSGDLRHPDQAGQLRHVQGALRRAAAPRVLHVVRGAGLLRERRADLLRRPGQQRQVRLADLAEPRQRRHDPGAGARSRRPRQHQVEVTSTHGAADPPHQPVSAIVTSLRRLSATPSSTAEQQAAQFRPGDELALGAGGATVQIRQVAGDRSASPTTSRDRWTPTAPYVLALPPRRPGPSA